MAALERGAHGYAQRAVEVLAPAYDRDRASFDPKELETDAIWSSIWDRANPEQRKLIVAIAESILRKR
jgi:hypothetical protein